MKTTNKVPPPYSDLISPSLSFIQVSNFELTFRPEPPKPPPFFSASADIKTSS